MPGPMLAITDLLRDAADALDECRQGPRRCSAGTLAFVALRERVEHITAGKPALDEPGPNAATIAQDEP
jgi:hypothetical protein